MGSDTQGFTRSGELGPSDLGQIRAYASHVLAGCSAERVTEVRRLEGGENHAVYRLSYLDVSQEIKDVVIRVATSDSARDCAAAGREATTLRKVQGRAAPRLHDFRCDSEWFDAPVMCMGFIKGVQRAPRDAHEFERLGHTVGSIHALPAEDLDSWLPAAATIEGYLETRLSKIAEKLPSVRGPLPVTVQDRLRRAVVAVREVVEGARTAETLETNESLVLLHGDVAGGNIVWTPDPVLIDWEYARIGDPADEIAYIFAQHDCTMEQRTRFWSGYQQSYRRDRPLDCIVDRTLWWEPVTIVGSALFWAQLWIRRADADARGNADASAPRDQDYYSQQTIQRLDRFENLIEQQRR